MEPLESDLPASTRVPGTHDALHRLQLSYREAVDELTATERARDLAFEMLAECEERLARVQALVDLAEWAQENDRSAVASVRASDLRRALE